MIFFIWLQDRKSSKKISPGWLGHYLDVIAIFKRPIP